jgi:hypothetical protein
MSSEVRDRLAPYEVDPPSPYLRGACRQRWRIFLGRCFQKAVQYLFRVDEDAKEGAFLVHGTCRGQHGRVDHAWVELPGGIVFDGVLQRFYRWEDYERELAAVAGCRYSAKEAARLLLSHNHNGPWEE